MSPLYILLFIGLVIATYRDVKVREVPDLVSLGLISLGILASLIIALLRNNLQVLLESVLGLLLAAIIGFLMYHTKQWGGGDAKLLMGVGAILGAWQGNYKLAAFCVLLILLGAVYGLCYTIGLAIKNRKVFLSTWKTLIRTPRVHRVRIVLVFTAFALLIAAIFVTGPLRIFIGALLICMYILTYLWIAITIVEKGILIKQYPVAKLTEGDWILADVRVKGKLIVPKRAIGLTKADIVAIKKAKVKQVLVREGIPFAPSFLLAFLALVLLENVWQIDIASLL